MSSQSHHIESEALFTSCIGSIQQTSCWSDRGNHPPLDILCLELRTQHPMLSHNATMIVSSKAQTALLALALFAGLVSAACKETSPSTWAPHSTLRSPNNNSTRPIFCIQRQPPSANVPASTTAPSSLSTRPLPRANPTPTTAATAAAAAGSSLSPAANPKTPATAPTTHRNLSRIYPLMTMVMEEKAIRTTARTGMGRARRMGLMREGRSTELGTATIAIASFVWIITCRSVRRRVWMMCLRLVFVSFVPFFWVVVCCAVSSVCLYMEGLLAALGGLGE